MASEVEREEKNVSPQWDILFGVRTTRRYGAACALSFTRK
jgi:hypothetical protein